MRAFAVYGFVPALLWLGFVLAISFMEAPLKFRAPGVSRSQALAVGQVVFRALNLVESIFLLAVLQVCRTLRLASVGRSCLLQGYLPSNSLLFALHLIAASPS